MGLDVHLTMQVLGLQNGSNMGPSVGTYLSREVFTLAGAVMGYLPSRPSPYLTVAACLCVG